jgi:hypothetical protein
LAACFLILGCAEHRTTYRELDEMSVRYQREAAQQQHSPPATQQEATERDTCGARAYINWIGKPVAEIAVPNGARVIAPDSMVTEDFRPNRLNIMVDAEGVITGFGCY